MQEEKTEKPAPSRYALVYCYAPKFAVENYLRLGWVPTRALIHTHHGEHAVLMEWQCGCEPTIPRDRYDD